MSASSTPIPHGVRAKLIVSNHLDPAAILPVWQPRKAVDPENIIDLSPFLPLNPALLLELDAVFFVNDCHLFKQKA